ncbi:MAG: hypothetical protein AAGK04_14040, partial [Planctomycetota bacterium]
MAISFKRPARWTPWRAPSALALSTTHSTAVWVALLAVFLVTPPARAQFDNPVYADDSPTASVSRAV